MFFKIIVQKYLLKAIGQFGLMGEVKQSKIAADPPANFST